MITRLNGLVCKGNSSEYEGTIIEVFARLVEGGYIYKGLKPIYWCFNCETALAEAEVEYGPHLSPSIYVKFAVEDEDKKKLLEAFGIDDDSKVSLLVWTTTPWSRNHPSDCWGCGV